MLSLISPCNLKPEIQPLMCYNYQSFIKETEFSKQTNKDLSMAIQKNSVVTLHYEMFDADDQLLDKTEQPIAYLHGGYDGIFPLVEEALHGKETGDVIDIVLQPDDAFGEQDPGLVRIEDADVFPVEVEVGMMFEADDPETGDVWVYRVTDVADGKAVVDGNHPLAGMKIRFKATVDSVRDASEEEIAHGHVHGEHGHHH